MSFSASWEAAYARGEQRSRWPWSELVSLVHRLWDRRSKWRVLELGCGAGANVALFESLGFDYYGVDGSETAIERLRAERPELASSLATADFTVALPFDGPFDLVFDRAALTHNEAGAVRAAVDAAWRRIVPGGHFAGVHWFSDRSSWASQGEPIGDEGRTRGRYASGPFVRIDPVHFFSEDEIRGLFAAGEFVAFEHVEHREILGPPAVHAMWSFAVRKPGGEPGAGR